MCATTSKLPSNISTMNDRESLNFVLSLQTTFIQTWIKYNIFPINILVLILDGNSEMGAHVRISLCYLTCERHLIWSRAILVTLRGLCRILGLRGGEGKSCNFIIFWEGSKKCLASKKYAEPPPPNHYKKIPNLRKINHTLDNLIFPRISPAQTCFLKFLAIPGNSGGEQRHLYPSF